MSTVAAQPLPAATVDMRAATFNLLSSSCPDRRQEVATHFVAANVVILVGAQISLQRDWGR
eukprot:12339404-Alexandrium_andersonii.AAC.1